MSAKEMLQKLGETLGSSASVKSVYGDPIHLDGKTVVPVATVAYGFGAGFGTGPGKHQSDAQAPGEGGGGGGGVKAFPAGALEITETGTRFISFHDMRAFAAVFAVGVVFGALLVRRIKF
jgi:uncharacterized spore protein YtfJ